jgi:DNA repair protein RecO (recombination protein O)
MLVKTKGIVFRTIKYSETSVITDIFTREKGLKSYIVNGIRKAKPTFSASLFQIMSQVNLLAYDHEHKSLNRIKEIRADYNYSHIPFNIIRSSIGVFMTELCQKSIKEREPNIKMYDFLSNWYIFLDSYEGSLANFPLLFMIELSTMLGFQPMDNFDVEERPYFNLEEGYFTKSLMDGKYIMDEKVSYNFQQFIQINRNEIQTLSISKGSRAELIKNLILFFQLHIENFPKLNSVEVLAEVLK